MVAGIPYIDTATGQLKYQGTSGTPGILVDAAGGVSLIPFFAVYAAISGSQETNSSGFTAIGTAIFDPSILWSGNTKVTRGIKFQAVLEATSGVTAEIQLYNISAGAAVTSSALSTSANIPTIVEGTLTIGASPNIPNSQQIYEVQLRISAPGSPAPSDRAICKLGQLIVTWS